MIKKSVTKSQILSKITEFHVFKKYAPRFDVGKKFFGDIGRNKKEKKPSANIIFVKNRWRYVDFGIGTFSCWDYMMAKFNISYQEALEKADRDFGLGFSYDSNDNISYRNTQYQFDDIYVPEKVQKPRSIIKIKSANWNKDDLSYWNRNGWTLDMLNAAKIKPINSFFIKDSEGNLIRHNRSNELAFAYEYYKNPIDNIQQYKIYSPERIDFGKFYSNVDNTIVQNIKTLPKHGEILFITSSLKDCGQTWRINKRPNAIASNTEGSFILDKVFYELKNRFKMIVLWLDADETGLKNMKKFSSIYKIPYIFHNPKFGKDQSEIWSNYGGRFFNNVLKYELNDKY